MVRLSKTGAGDNAQTHNINLIVGTAAGDAQMRTLLAQGYVISKNIPHAQNQEVPITYFFHICEKQ